MEAETQYNIPGTAPAMENPPANFERYYNYNVEPQNEQTPPPNGFVGGYQTNQPAGTYRQNPMPPQYNQPYGNPAMARQMPPPVQNQPPLQNVYKQATKFCKFCGQKIVADAVVCTHCGRQVEEFMRGPSQPAQNINCFVAPQQSVNPYGQMNVSRKSKTVALILAVIGGYLGLHRFYSGRVLSGLLYMFTGGLFMIGVIYDIIRIATDTFTDSSGYLIKKD